MSWLPNVSLQILPYSAGEHPLMASSVTVLHFHGNSQLDVAYLEGLGRAEHFEKRPVEVARYREPLDRLSATALDQQATRNMIERLLAP